MHTRYLAVIAILLVVLCSVAFVSGCDDDDDPIRPSDAPATHTVNQDGIGHAPGLNDPDENCASCHGTDLRGSGDVPSCFACHGREW